MKYSEIRPRLRTGDILCWSGTGLMSNVIKMAQLGSGHGRTAANISHVGLVVLGDDMRMSNDWFAEGTKHAGRVLTFESTTLEDVPDIRDGTRKSGVLVRPLTDKLANYRGSVWVRRLAQAPVGFVHDVLNFMHDHHGTEYENNIPKLFLSVLGLTTGWRPEDVSTMFCSETICALLEYANVLDKGAQDSDAICPAEIYNIERLGIRAPAHYLPAVAIKMDCKA